MITVWVFRTKKKIFFFLLKEKKLNTVNKNTTQVQKSNLKICLAVNLLISTHELFLESVYKKIILTE